MKWRRAPKARLKEYTKASSCFLSWNTNTISWCWTRKQDRKRSLAHCCILNASVCFSKMQTQRSGSEVERAGLWRHPPSFNGSPRRSMPLSIRFAISAFVLEKPLIEEGRAFKSLTKTNNVLDVKGGSFWDKTNWGIKLSLVIRKIYSTPSAETKHKP